MTTKKTCPVCGSAEVSTRMARDSVSAPLGPAVEYDAVMDTCERCHEEGDFNSENDERLREAFDKSEHLACRAALERLNERGVSCASFERALRLPQRTTSRWKEGKLSAGSSALVKIVDRFPWVLDVADADFDEEIAIKELISASAEFTAVACKRLAIPHPEPVRSVIQIFVTHAEQPPRAKFAQAQPTISAVSTATTTAVVHPQTRIMH